MSSIEYNDLLFNISQSFSWLEDRQRVLFLLRKVLVPNGEVGSNIEDVLSLFSELENQNRLGIDHLDVLKDLLRAMDKYPQIDEVEKFEIKRRNYRGLLNTIVLKLDEVRDLQQQAIAMCRDDLGEDSECDINDVRALFEELERRDRLGPNRLFLLRGILAETNNQELLEKVEEFAKRRTEEEEAERKRIETAVARQGEFSLNLSFP